MKVGDTVKSKSTNLLYKVVQKKENRAGYICEPVTAIMHPDEKFYFFDDEVDVVSEKTELSTEEKDMNEKELSLKEVIERIESRYGFKLEETDVKFTEYGMKSMISNIYATDIFLK